VEKGTLVEFHLHGKRHLAVAERSEGKKHWVVVNERGQSYKLSPRQITYEVAGQAYQTGEISQFLNQVAPFLDPSSLEVAWEVLLDDSSVAINPSELALLLFSSQDPPLCYAAHCLLVEDKLYFKQKGELYEPRSANQVAELKHQFEREAQRIREREDFLERLRLAFMGQTVDWQDSDRPRLEALERFAALGEDASHRAPALEILAALGRSETPQAAFGLLIELGLWSAHENLFVRRSQIPTYFPAKVVAGAQRCLEAAPPDLDANNRLDLTHLKVHTIDDESTQEIDDGLSLEYLPDGRQKVWIHVADPTRWISPGDELDLEARRRGTSLYLPTGMVPMFPPDLATGPMSLVQGQVCSALSFGVILSAEGAVADFSIHTSLIKPTYRLTYEDVDEMVELAVQAEPELLAIAAWAKQRCSWRESQGAITINMPESSIKVSGNEILIEVINDSPARRIVAEMMILAGEVAALYGQAHSLAIPFRFQPQPELPSEEELLQLPPGPVRGCAIRRCMPRSEVGITPARHASLGLDAYSQATSPIRRYADLLTHFQIKAHLRGEEPPFSAEALKALLISVVAVTQEATLVERQTNRYWSLEYLRRHSDQIWQSLLLRWLREHERLGLVLLEDLGLELAMRFNRSLSPGDSLQVKVSYVDPRHDTIQLEELIYQEAQ